MIKQADKGGLLQEMMVHSQSAHPLSLSLSLLRALNDSVIIFYFHEFKWRFAYMLACLLFKGWAGSRAGGWWVVVCRKIAKIHRRHIIRELRVLGFIWKFNVGFWYYARCRNACFSTWKNPALFPAKIAQIRNYCYYIGVYVYFVPGRKGDSDMQ